MVLVPTIPLALALEGPGEQEKALPLVTASAPLGQGGVALPLFSGFCFFPLCMFNYSLESNSSPPTIMVSIVCPSSPHFPFIC